MYLLYYMHDAQSRRVADRHGTKPERLRIDGTEEFVHTRRRLRVAKETGRLFARVG